MALLELKIIDLPNEVIERVSSLLDARSLARLGGTCKTLQSVSNIDTLWHVLCQEDYGVCHNKGWNLTYRHIYTKILHPYPILGFKRLALQPYGGLLHIMWAESEIKVNRLYPRDFYTKPLVVEPTFSLTWNQKTKNLDVKCVQTPDKDAPATILKDGPYFVFQCQKKKCLRSHKRSPSMGQTNPSMPEGFTDHPEAFKSFNFSNGYNCPILPMEFRPTPVHFPITPGLYKGDFGYEELEIIQIRFNESKPNVLEGLKIIGDPNVPAGNISIMIYLDKPVRLVKEEQRSFRGILDADKHRPKEEYLNLLQTDGQENWHQPFILPRNCFDEHRVSHPSVCMARYLGDGRIAGLNYQGPTMCKIHMIKFDNDTFGILWLDLSGFTMLQREKNLLKLVAKKYI